MDTLNLFLLGFNLGMLGLLVGQFYKHYQINLKYEKEVERLRDEISGKLNK
ncbi:hypothetical protein [Globicatella sp. PHS-GS-PNBC-21-1553]|uniref:hypothetical protein n=1 Tax=Globicatella sp. PHS-GS-PNBC-21-1553 TaxID=2885764 RepID=UPI00298F0B2C|nr:hypothetical protein [Globicatella sp. PHS-GS-PNBC-21-1553]WPC08620.1 hypothetical protein LB888_11625 [Globicatella sp. PHS-GS-PNBC-21-1553]